MANVNTPRIDANVASPSSNVTLTSADAYTQVLTPSAAIDVVLPSTGITQGSVHTIRNTQFANKITVKSSDGAQLDIIAKGKLVAVALVDDPSTVANWDILSINSYEELDLSSGSGDFDSQSTVVSITRENSNISLTWGNLSHSADTSTTDANSATGFIPSELAPFGPVRQVYQISSSAVNKIFVTSDGRFNFQVLDWNGGRTSSTNTAGGSVSWAIDT